MVNRFAKHAVIGDVWPGR